MSREYADESMDKWEEIESSEPDDDSEAAYDVHLRSMGVNTDHYLGDEDDKQGN